MTYIRQCMAVLVTALMPGFCLAADLFASQTARQAFMAALRKQDERYDPAEKMIRRPFSSPGYHTTLKGGYVHPTRDSLNYAVALYDSGEPNRVQKAEQILRRVIALQDQNPDSRTYGIWSWFLEEPLDKMSPPDWNWADFCGTQLLQIAIDHTDRLPDDLQGEIRRSIIHAARSIKRRNVGPGYTNIALMGAYVTLVAGERFNDPELIEYGKGRLRRFYDYTLQQGSFTEYNSPTYTVVAIEEISRMIGHVRDDQSQKLLIELNRLAWRHVARHFHPPTKQWAGPHSRSYSTLLRSSTLAFIQRGAAGAINFMLEPDAYESLSAQRIALQCPQEFLGYFTEIKSPRVEVETFTRNQPKEHDIIGTTYLHPDFTLGSVNIGDLWNQRRPLVAYWNTGQGPASVSLRCLHDDYDYASAGMFTVQDEADVLGAVVFATDRGDTHISLDRIKDATIKARNLRIRLQFEGAVADLTLPQKVQPHELVEFSSGQISGSFCPFYAIFDDYPIKFETGRNSDLAWIDIVLYSGPQRQINFAQMKRAALIFTLSLRSQRPSAEPTETSDQKGKPTVSITTIGDAIRATWRTPGNGLSPSLSGPIKPLPTAQQRIGFAATLGSSNPWKTQSPLLPPMNE